MVPEQSASFSRGLRSRRSAEAARHSQFGYRHPISGIGIVQRMTSSSLPTGAVTFVFTDVVDSTHHWEVDHLAMGAAMEQHDEVMAAAVESHSGTIVKQTGDGIFAAFDSALDAIVAAQTIRTEIQQRDWGSIEHFAVRVGVHTGEANLRGDDYFGQAVNRAARVMSLAGADEVLVSHATHDLVVDRLPGNLMLRDLGEREIRGMTRPERVFALGDSGLHAERPAPHSVTVAPERESKRAAWVAVLPFVNIGNDPEQEYFADGVAEDIISGLARWRSLRIVSRSSSFQFRGEDMPISAIAAALGVEYIIEGSVRRAGDRIRVTASLIEVADEHTVWTSRYDVELDDIFAVQDEIAMTIVNAINPAIVASAATRATRVRPDDLDAWDYVQRGQAELLRFRREPNGRARAHFLAAIDIDPDYAAAYSGLAWTYAMGTWLNWEPDYQSASDLAHEYANRAIELDSTDPDAYAARAMASYTKGRLDAVRRDADRAIDLNPSYAAAYMLAAAGRVHAGNPEAGLEMMHHGLELSPRDPAVAWFHGLVAVGEFVAGRPEKTIEAARAAVAARYGYLFGRVLLVVGLVENGQLDEARVELAAMIEIHPDFTIDLLNPYTFADEADRERIVNGLRAAGFDG